MTQHDDVIISKWRTQCQLGKVKVVATQSKVGKVSAMTSDYVVDTSGYLSQVGV